jgi:cell division protein FtsL
MTLENALLAALSAVTSGLVYVARLLWVKQEQCEKDRYSLREEIEELKLEHGVATGRLSLMQRCPMKNCPYISKTVDQ